MCSWSYEEVSNWFIGKVLFFEMVLAKEMMGDKEWERLRIIVLWIDIPPVDVTSRTSKKSHE